MKMDIEEAVTKMYLGEEKFKKLQEIIDSVDLTEEEKDLKFRDLMKEREKEIEEEDPKRKGKF